MVLHLFNRPCSDWNFVGKHANKEHFPCKRPSRIWFGVRFGQTALHSCSQKQKRNGLTPNKLQFDKKSPFWGNSSREAFTVSELVRNTAIRIEKIVWTTKVLKDWYLIRTNSKEKLRYLALAAVICNKSKKCNPVGGSSFVQPSVQRLKNSRWIFKQ